MNYFPVTVQGYSSGCFLSRWDTLCYPIMQCRCLSLCPVKGWLSIWVFRAFTQPRHGVWKEQTSKLHVPEGCNTRESSEVTWNRAFWSHIDTPQENILISGMVKYFVLLENVRQNAVTLPEKEKNGFGVFFDFFSPKFPPREKILTFQLFVPMWDENKHWNVRICSRVNFAKFLV